MIDKSVTNPINILHPDNLSIILSRPPIRMKHDKCWSVNKINPTHDIFICLTGSAQYCFNKTETYQLSEGDALLALAGTNFQGHIIGDKIYTGIAQHFEIKLCNKIDLLPFFRFKRKITFSRWPKIKPIVQLYHEENIPEIQRNSLWRVILFEFLNEAYENKIFNISCHYHVLNAALKITNNIGGNKSLDDILTTLPYSKDYFLRMFKKNLGMTPLQFQNYQKIEHAKKYLSLGYSVKKTSLLCGYNDQYYFSRIFKKITGFPPRDLKFK